MLLNNKDNLENNCFFFLAGVKRSAVVIHQQALSPEESALRRLGLVCKAHNAQVECGSVFAKSPWCRGRGLQFSGLRFE